MQRNNQNTDQIMELIYGLDYYIENGKFVFTAHYLLHRGYCCQNKCRHCPYGNAPDIKITSL